MSMKMQDFVNPTKLIDKAKLGMKGAAGYAAATVALEFGTQLLDRYILAPHFPQLESVMTTNVVSNAPLLGPVDVRDTIVLMPAIQQGYKTFADKTGRSKHFTNAIVAYGTKVVLRKTGLNPKEMANKADKIIHPQTQSLPSVI